MVQKGDGRFFVRAPLRCVPASQNRACWEQLRASLRRKELNQRGASAFRKSWILKRLFQNRLVLESGLVKMYYFASL
jgi:hypothetical protein